MANQGVIDDREHRRGLVLGLTMAEVLLLLLFLLLLALGTQMKKLESERNVLKDKLSVTLAERDKLTLALGLGAGAVDRLVHLQTENSELKLVISDLRSKLAIQSPSSASVGTADTAQLMEKAKAINPNDPPAVLERALEDHVALRESVRGSVLSDATAQSIGDLALEAYEARQAGASADAGHKWPPIINLSEAQGYYFETGNAELRPDFKAALTGKISDELIQILNEYDVDLIEVVGHTDERPLHTGEGNLDTLLIGALNGHVDASRLVPADNAGLGMARAVSVVNALSSDPRLGKYRILPLSAAQAIDTDERVSKGTRGDIRERRRIEIRVRQSSEVRQPNASAQ